jgi:hypothetical protein
MNLKRAKELLSLYISADLATFLWGPPGVGKSSLIEQLAAEQGVKVIDFRCSTRDPVALMGLPDIAGDTARWKVPDEFPQVKRDGEKGFLFLDELNVAAPSMQAAAFGLVLDRRVGEYRMPPGWRVIAAGNRQADKAAAQRMPSALANRFAHIDVDADVDTVVNHFIDLDVDPLLLAFLRFRPALLHNMEGASDLRAFPTPRSWERAAKVIKAPDSMRGEAIRGIVGDAASAEFEGFVRVYQQLPSLDLVLANTNSAPVPTEPAAKFAIAAGLARKVDAKSFENGMNYMKRISGREFEIMFTVDAVRRDNKLSHTQAFTDWAVRNQDVTFK